jgi:hypothetical protein
MGIIYRFYKVVAITTTTLLISPIIAGTGLIMPFEYILTGNVTNTLFVINYVTQKFQKAFEDNFVVDSFEEEFD